VRVIETLTHSLTHSLGWCVGHEIVSERNTDGLSFRFKTQLAPDVSRQTTIERVTMLVSYHAATGRGGDTPTGWLRGGKTEYMSHDGAYRRRYGQVWGLAHDVEHDRRTFVHVHFRVLGRVYP
jgi:hypothetical protein